MAGYNPGSSFSKSSPYGWRNNPTKPGQREFHGGLDFGAPAGTPIPAAADGKVVYSGYNSRYGNTVIIRHVGADGSVFYTVYAHMNGEDMPARDTVVQAGDPIGQVGNTGASKGNHLHFEIIEGATPANADGGPVGTKGVRDI